MTAGLVVPLAAAKGVAGLRDVPLQLRALADSVERDAAAYGEGFVCRCVIVLRTSNEVPAVIAYGDIEHMAQAYMDLHAGADQLMGMRRPGR